MSDPKTISLKPPKVSLKPPTYPPLMPSTLFPAEPANSWRQIGPGRHPKDLTDEEASTYDWSNDD